MTRNVKHLGTATVDVLTTVLAGPAFQTSRAIAARIGRHLIPTDQLLRRLYHRGLVERASEAKEFSGFLYLWRAVPDDQIAPLYDVQPGIDCRTLAACWGGYTYLKPKEHHA